MRKNIKKRLRQVMPCIFGTILIGVILYLGDVSKLDNLWKADPKWLGMALLCTWFHIQLSGMRWETILKFINPYRDYPPGFFSRAVLLGLISGLVVTQEVGLAATRLVMLQTSTPVPTEQTIFSITVDRLLDFF